MLVDLVKLGNNLKPYASPAKKLNIKLPTFLQTTITQNLKQIDLSLYYLLKPKLKH